MTENREFLRRNIQDFKDGIQKLAGLLANHKVKVIFRGTICATDGDAIVLPSVDVLENSGASDEEITDFISALVGFVDHEVGHILYSDMDYWRSTVANLRPLTRHLTNAIEDAYVERRMRKLWRGSGPSIKFKTNYIIKERKGEYKDLPPKMQIEQLITLLSKGSAFRYVVKYFDQDLVRWVDAHLDEEISAVSKVKSTRASVKLAKRIVRKINKAFKKPKEKKPEDGFSSGEPPGRDADDMDAGKDDEAGSGQTSEPDTGRDDDSEGGPELEDEDDSEETEGEEELDSEADPVDEEEFSDEADPVDEDGGDGSDEEEIESSLSEESTEYRESDDDDALTKKFRHLASQLSGPEPAYAPYSTEDDYIGPMRRTTDEDWAQLMQHQLVRKVNSDFHERLVSAERLAAGTAGQLKVALGRVLKARGTAYTVRDLDQGKLDRRRLYRLATAPTTHPRVKKADIKEENYNLAVLIVVNESSSMSTAVDSKLYTRMDVATASALVLGDVLQSLGIVFGILGHTTSSWLEASEAAKRASALDRELFCRFGSLKIEWVKQFYEPWLQARPMIGGLGFQNNTNDAEVLAYAAKVIESVPNVDRRMIIMLDDGAPEPSNSAYRQRHERELLRVSGAVRSRVELVGIGIATDSVAMYYPDYVVVKDAAELPVVLLSKFGELLGARKFNK